VRAAVDRGGIAVAYLNLLGSISEAEVMRLRGDRTTLLFPTIIGGVSHPLAYWVHAQPLGDLLVRAIDGGAVIRPELWHPLRPPLFHGPATVRELSEQIGGAVASMALPEDD
jgi:hypothetical protein